MIPQTLLNETRSIGKPRDWDEEINGPCDSLSVYDYEDQAGNHMVSGWRPTEEELQSLNNGGYVWLEICGTIHPVIKLYAAM